MANKRIRTDAPDTVQGVQRRAASIKPDSASMDEDFNSLCLDTLVGIAEKGKPGHRRPDDPVKVAREVLRVGAELYESGLDGDPSWWLTYGE